ncbi:rhodanese-like domain-containing protein [Nosocomiicoccus ampullae]|uniref:Rhodanese-related sulfurtransferase n=1 Tax=Nosocomiicoccus ampullae TaxID=489910 RepID=A0A9Q2D016_9STAP|nr:rhodanese-like domain-containing protein [Nosocomiicoccus ampullae]MBB5176418.1 rhodanese-related sulfurtransferase [Nosocomiicoccus ampullae]QYA47603.1 rhodanese-like domain-containing protein [Nosocomiicoccus ampullae]QYA49233.1 rhodanese-like domain-containing protein [Nosocomiicoccus ampullae]HJB78098.1 rhodanese-like domain-containing protein [Candidatus Nosocomiicoccus stercorigallinarum]
MSTTTIILLIILAILIILFIVNAVISVRGVNIVDENEFSENLRKVQLVDLREKEAYKHGHILGARNIPLSTFNSRAKSLRTDQPVHLYDQNGRTALRAARILKKLGHKDIYVLKSGISKWTGKINKK